MLKPNDTVIPDAMFNIVGCEMDYVCKKLWSELTPTWNANVRNCSDCMKPVTFCTDQETLAKLASGDVCVAYLRGELWSDRMTIGLPAPRNAKLRTYLDEL